MPDCYRFPNMRMAHTSAAVKMAAAMVPIVRNTLRRFCGVVVAMTTPSSSMISRGVSAIRAVRGEIDALAAMKVPMTTVETAPTMRVMMIMTLITELLNTPGGTCVNAVDDHDDDNDNDQGIVKTPYEYPHLCIQSIMMKMIMTMIKPCWGHRNGQQAMGCLHTSTFGIKV